MSRIGRTSAGSCSAYLIMVAMGQGAGGRRAVLSQDGRYCAGVMYPEASVSLSGPGASQPHDRSRCFPGAGRSRRSERVETARELLAAALEQEVRDSPADRAVPFYLEGRQLAPRLRLSREAFYRIGGWLGEQAAWGERAPPWSAPRRWPARGDGRDGLRASRSAHRARERRDAAPGAADP